MAFFLKNIHRLYRVASAGQVRKTGASMQDAEPLENAWVLCEGDRIQAVGTMDKLPEQMPHHVQSLDCTGRVVLPGFVDSHTHIVFAKTREAEFVDRIRGLSYEEIAANGGGILNSARKLAVMSEQELLDGALERAWEVLGYGTTTIEIKSGYGLSTESELKMLRVAKKLRDLCPLRICTTFLGAHAIPMEYRERREDYIRLVTDEMLPQVAEEGLAEFIDVFCDRGFFTPDETARILEAGAKYGLRPKIHANELGLTGGVQVGVAHGALSVDHLEHVGPEETEALVSGDTVATLLPGTAFFLNIDYAPARALIDAGATVALATDYNPGSCPGGSMPFVLSLAATQMKMLPEEALIASTLHGALALGLEKECGSVEPGKRADLVITQDLDNLAQIPYYFSRNLVSHVMCGGMMMGEH